MFLILAEETSNNVDLSIATLVVFVIFEKVMGMLKSRGIDLQKMSQETSKIHQLEEDIKSLTEKTKDLHTWHDINDENGVKIWYVRKSLEDNIAKLTNSIELEARILDRMDRRMERIEEEIKAKKNT